MVTVSSDESWTGRVSVSLPSLGENLDEVGLIRWNVRAGVGWNEVDMINFLVTCDRS